MKSAIILASTASLASALAQLKPAVGAQLTSAKRVDESSRGKRAQDICVETEGKVVQKQASFEEFKQVCKTEGLCRALHAEPLLWETIPELAGWAIGHACSSANLKRSVDETSRGKRAWNRCLETEVSVIKKEVSFEDWRQVCKTEGLCRALNSEPLLYENIPELVGWAISKTCLPDLPEPSPAQYSCLETEGRVLKKLASFEEWEQVCKKEGLCRALNSEPLLYENIPELHGWALAQACASAKPSLNEIGPGPNSCVETERKVLQKEATFQEWKQVCGTNGLCRAFHSEPLLYESIPELSWWAIAQTCPSSNGA